MCVRNFQGIMLCIHCSDIDSMFVGKQMSVWLYLKGGSSKSKSESLRPQTTGNVIEDWFALLLDQRLQYILLWSSNAHLIHSIDTRLIFAHILLQNSILRTSQKTIYIYPNFQAQTKWVSNQCFQDILL